MTFVDDAQIHKVEIRRDELELLPYWLHDRWLAIDARNKNERKAAAEHREMLEATRSAFVPDWRFKSVNHEPNHHQSTPGRVSWTIRGAA